MNNERKQLSKIKAKHYMSIWFAASLIIGIVVPLLCWILFHKVITLFIIMGVVGLLIFFVVLILQKYKRVSKATNYESHLKDMIQYDPATQYAVIRSSICTGEKVAGFKNKKDGHFMEVMVIRSVEDENRFKEIFELDTIRTEY